MPTAPIYTNWQILNLTLSSDTTYHFLYITALFITTSTVYRTARADWIFSSLFDENRDDWYGVYATAWTVLRFELCLYFANFGIRSYHEATHAESTEAGWSCTTS